MEMLKAIERKQEFNKEKFKEMILCIVEKSKKDERFGAVKLNKILYYSDFIAYRNLGHSVTGATYQHLGEGPAPKEFLQAKEELEQEKLVNTEYRPYFNRVQHRLVAKRSCNKGLFSSDEMDIVDIVIKALWEFNGTEVSLQSHKEYGYKLTEEGETIPYSSAYFSSQPLDADQEMLGREIANKYGLLVG
jgi:hypothetical protein